MLTADVETFLPVVLKGIRGIMLLFQASLDNDQVG
jgi:hypothetical protein